MTAPAVEVTGLRREYRTRGRARKASGPVVALDDLDLVIAPGSVHGLLGPNGAGKTTLVKILSTVLLPTAGEARVLGHDVARDPGPVRERIGIVFGGERGLYTRLTARQNLRYWAALHRLPDDEGRRRADALLGRVGLAERADDRVEEFSRGMQQRLHLARGLIGDPAVLFLDEPTTGLDPIAALDFRRLIGELRGEGRTVLLTTHDMVEAEAVCDRVSLIDRGRLLADEAPRTLSTWIARYERVDTDDAPPEVLDRIAALPGVSRVAPREDGGHRIETDREGTTGEVLRQLVSAGVTDVRTSLPTLAEVYVHLVGDRGLEV
jgi:ABC-2 type transport system ATP-binding protein